jgi:hypothetical protein
VEQRLPEFEKELKKLSASHTQEEARLEGMYEELKVGCSM